MESLISEAFGAPEISLKNKTALVTGASSGIGLATAAWLAREGSHLILVARRLDRLNAVAKELRENFAGVKVKVVCSDVRSKNFIADLEKASALDVDILINNAGLARGADHAVDLAEEDLREMIDTNVTAAFLLAAAVAKKMVSRGSGHIINIGSTAGHTTYEGGSVYCATKFAVRAFSETLRQELYDKNVRITLISPGMVNTEFSTVRFKGDKNKSDAVYENFACLHAADIARSILKTLKEPLHVNWDEVLVLASAQAPVSRKLFRKNP